MSRFKSGAYTQVREHFEPDHNAAISQKINVLNLVFFDDRDEELLRRLQRAEVQIGIVFFD